MFAICDPINYESVIVSPTSVLVDILYHAKTSFKQQFSISTHRPINISYNILDKENYLYQLAPTFYFAQIKQPGAFLPFETMYLQSQIDSDFDLECNELFSKLSYFKLIVFTTTFGDIPLIFGTTSEIHRGRELNIQAMFNYARKTLIENGFNITKVDMFSVCSPQSNTYFKIHDTLRNFANTQINELLIEED